MEEEEEATEVEDLLADGAPPRLCWEKSLGGEVLVLLPKLEEEEVTGAAKDRRQRVAVVDGGDRDCWILRTRKFYEL